MSGTIGNSNSCCSWFNNGQTTEEADGLASREEKHMEVEDIKAIRQFAICALCFASVSLLTAVLLIPMLFTHARNVQSSVDQNSSNCLNKLAHLYNQMDGIVKKEEQSRKRHARHMPSSTKNALRQAIKNQRKTRYLQQKLVETASLLNSNEIWEENPKNVPTTKSKDDAKSLADSGAEIGSSSASAEESASTKSPNNNYQPHSVVFDSSSSFEIGSSENHWHSQKQIGGYDFSTSFPLPTFPRVSPKIHSGSRESSTTIAPSSTVGFSLETAEQGQTKSKGEEQCCACIHGPPGPPGIAGADGLPGTDGRPGQNGLPGRDAPQAHKPSSDDFCFSCPQGPAGESGPEGPKGPPGKEGMPGEDGEPGRKGQPGRRGPAGAPGKPGNAGQKGRPGQPGRVITIPGPEGPPGSVGKPGPPGQPGPPGEPGFAESGRPGLMGRPGVDGKNGAVGRRGPAGAPGKQGPPGGCSHCMMPRTAPGY